MFEFIQQFFAYNRTIILFVYGQVFFILGLAIALQSWRHSRLALARNLNWLATFGFAHGLHEWGDVFIPIQATYLPTSVINTLLTLQVILLAASFASLFQYGIESLRPLPGRWRYLRYASATVLGVWLLYMFMSRATMVDNFDMWDRAGNILARYSLGVPGGFLAAYGLRRQAQRNFDILELKHITFMLRLMGLSLAGYSIMGGLIVPAGPFFPANILNQERLQELTLLPVQVYRSFLGLILMYATIRTMEIFQVEMDRRLIKSEETQALPAERERIGRELHDGTLQTIYAAGLLLRTAERNITRGDTHKEVQRLQQSITLLDEAVADIRSYVGTLRPQHTGQSLSNGLKELANAFHIRSLVETDLHLDVPSNLILSPNQTSRLLAIANEAMSNVARHARATKASLSVSVEKEWLCLQIADNGRGLPSDLVVGYGLNNMRDRARLLGGTLHLDSQPGQGTSVKVEIPIGDKNETTAYLAGG